MKRLQRSAILFLGSGATAVGVLLAWQREVEAAPAALILAGLVLVLLGIRGEWPKSLTLGNSGVEWFEATVEARLQTEENPAAQDALQDVLTEVRTQRNSIAHGLPHPAEAFDDAVAKALAPFGKVVRQARHGDQRFDFLLNADGFTIFVETKWLRPNHGTYNGSTIRRLIEGAPRGAKLLVIVNVADAALGSARRSVRDLTDVEVEFVGWRDASDSKALGNAIAKLLGKDTNQT